ncbi:histamine N-methyltransferase-like [Glandiceps talaboti]
MSMQRELASFMNHEEYHERYDLLLKNGLTTSRKNSVDDMNEVFGGLTIDTKKKLRVLSIGPGNGHNEVPIINALVRRYPNIVYETVEPSQEQIDKFRSLFQSKNTEWEGVFYKPNAQTIEKFTETRKSVVDEDERVNYDAIVALHSDYHFKGQGDTIHQLYDWLVKDGILLVRVGSGGWEKCSTKVTEFYRNPNIVYFGSESLYKSLQNVLPGVNIQIKRRPGRINISECFLENSEDGNKMLDMIFGILNFRKYVPPEKAKMLIEYMRDCCDREGDDVILPENDVDFIISK